MRSFLRLALTCLTLLVLLGIHCPTPLAAQSEPDGAAFTGHYPNLFTELLGVPEDEVQARVTETFEQYFYGDDETERIYYPVEPDMAYILDVLHDDVRSEGISYGMMAAVQMDRKEEFDRIWKWAKTHMQHQAGPHRNFFAWQLRADGTVIDRNSASDGEVWIVTALLFASNRWGDGEGIFAYSAEAQTILDAMLHKEDDPQNDGSVTNMFNHENRLVVFVPEAGLASEFTDPSYHVPHFFELWGRWAQRDNDFWCEAAAASRDYLRNATHPETGLAAEYSAFDGTPFAPPWHPGADKFHYDSFRVGANIGVDHVWFAPDSWHVEQNNRLLSFFASQGHDDYPNNYEVDGTPLTTDRSDGHVAANGAAALAADDPVRIEFVRRLWEMPAPAGIERYYDGTLYLLAMLQASGNFQIHGPVQAACGAP